MIDRTLNTWNGAQIPTLFNEFERFTAHNEVYRVKVDKEGNVYGVSEGEQHNRVFRWSQILDSFEPTN